MKALLRSAPQVPVPWQSLLAAVVMLWLAPMVAGWLLATLARLGTGFLSSETLLYIYGFAMLLMFSPIYSWIGWLLAMPIVWFLLRDGWFGWLPALGSGVLVGLAAGGIAETEAALPFAIVALLALRAVMGRGIPLAISH